MNFCGMPTWPPLWIKRGRTGQTTIKGEVGILQRVHFLKGEPYKTYLIIEHENEVFVGVLLVTDFRFWDHVTLLLSHQIGRSIREIGDLDMAAALDPE